jgi:hypothetical protein
VDLRLDGCGLNTVGPYGGGNAGEWNDRIRFGEQHLEKALVPQLTNGQGAIAHPYLKCAKYSAFNIDHRCTEPSDNALSRGSSDR